MNDYPSLPSIILHTPIWVWALLVLVLALGLQRTRDRVVSLRRMLLLPGTMALVALGGLAHGGGTSLLAALVGLAPGLVAGWWLERDGSTRRMPDGRLWLRGEWWSVIQILAIFLFRYVTNVIVAIDPERAASGGFRQLTALLSGFLAALFIGRTAARLRTYLSSEPDRADRNALDPEPR